jgi:probable rRNA maturation factor
MSLEVEVLDAELAAGRDDLPPEPEIVRLVSLAIATVGVDEGHLAVAFVDAARISQLNAEHRGKEGPTDVLSFPIDEAGAVPGPAALRELGDIVICPEHTIDIREAIVHGALHLVGMDHEVDDGEMLAIQAELLSW